MDILKNSLRLARLAGALLAIPAMAEEARIQPPELAISLTDKVLLPATQSLEAATGKLVESVTALCAAPSKDKLAEAQASWRGASVAWRRVEAARVGPLGRGNAVELIDPWPLDVQALDQALPKTPAEPTSPRAVGEWMQTPTTAGGLPAIEYLLFSEATPEKQLAQLKDSNRCRYALWQAAGVARRATTLGYEWRGLRTGLNYDLAYYRPFLTDALGRSIAGLKELAGWKLAHKDVTPARNRFPDWRAGQTKPSLLASFDGIRQVLLGDDKGIGFDDYLTSRGQDELVQQLNAKLVEARLALVQLPDDLADQAAQNRGERLHAQRKLNALADFLSGPFAQALGFPVDAGKKTD
ncbi:Iron-regulated protein A [Andreprevotia sp. IGB-42]|uniref:imelysin family protein n=1 Tax=Andreprevotia sp. IGB-42 TaxID=2497473 RepID=UPI00135A082C|nr:imelysin family protein [Andreprevotia sp. IGB-42]KAF0811847.1 Iron-regulated protein A [Andreprevotia sp. IGB-42]